MIQGFPTSAVQFGFLFEAAYLFLVILVRNATLKEQLKTILPKKKQLLAWIDALTELSFLHQTLLSTRKHIKAIASKEGGVQSNDQERIERAVAKISALLEKEASE